MEVDIDEDQMAWGEFMRIRMALDISKPLLWEKKFNVNSSQPCWVWITYKKYLTFATVAVV